RLAGHSSRMPEESSPKRSPQNIPYKDLPHIVNADGQHLFCRYWKPAATPSPSWMPARADGHNHGSCQICSDHAGNFLAFLHCFVPSKSLHQCVPPLHRILWMSSGHINYSIKEHPELPVLILGHSMGGAISILTASERPSEFSGMLLISPLVVASPEVATPIKVFAAKVLNIVLPNLSLGSIDPSAISRNKKEVRTLT
ncbi:MGLL lipase, partial [Columbina picui]|nr:MGLL lipase [Columbina picui]